MNRPALAAILAMMIVAPSTAGAAGPSIVVAGSAADFTSIAGELGIRLDTAPDVVGAVKSGRPVIVTATEYPRPRTLSAAEVGALASLGERHGRAFVEFAFPAAGSLAGLSPSRRSERTMFERIMVDEPLVSGLGPAASTLLEEHKAAALPAGKLPAGARTVAEYGRFAGTYTRFQPPPPVWTVTIDLGADKRVARVVGHFGAGQADYCPEVVRVRLSADGATWRDGPLAGSEGRVLPPEVAADAEGTARFVRLEVEKYRRSPTTDWLFLDEIEALDAEGNDLALGRTYAIAGTLDGAQGPYADDGHKLTNGQWGSAYLDGRSVGFMTRGAPDEGRRPAIVELPVGQGRVLWCATRITDFAARNFRLEREWRTLARSILLWLLPEAERAAVVAKWLPVEAWTEPRVWATPEEDVAVVVRTKPGAHVEVGARKTTAGPDGLARIAVEKLAVGRHEFDVLASAGQAKAHTAAVIDIAPRRERYRLALDRVMRWFERSGVMPAKDGSQGVWSQRCMAWLDGGPIDTLASPFRVDCNAMSAEAFYEYGVTSGDATWRDRAEKVAATVVAHQYTDAARASFGGFPWLYDHDEAIYFWDDNCRICMALLRMYEWTGKREYLEAALRSGELFRQVAREDGCVWNHCISRTDLDRTGRAAYRARNEGPGGAGFDAMRWYTLAALTGDGEYAKMMDALVDTRTGLMGLPGDAYAARWRGGEEQRTALASDVAAWLANPDVRRVGAPRTAGAWSPAAFLGDSGLGTTGDEPLSDQLYSSSWLMLWAWEAYKAGCPDARQLVERVGDYLARIQFASPDARLDGCWMRGFDFDNWEYYGAPYDPAYGPYSAYTGWMNAIIARAFAVYLRDADAFLPREAKPAAAAMLSAVRAENPPDYVSEENLAQGATYTLAPAPQAGPYADDGTKLTDGLVDGRWGDGRSVGWSIAQVGAETRVTMTLDLGQQVRVGDVSQRYGALEASYNPDAVTVAGSLDGQQWATLGEALFGRDQPGYLYLRVKPARAARYLRFELVKRRMDGVTDFMFVGETRVFGALRDGGK